MLKRWSKKIAILGITISLFGAASAIFKINTDLNYQNIASDPRWVRPQPSAFDAFVMSFPVREVFLFGIALLIAGLLAMLFQRHAG